MARGNATALGLGPGFLYFAPLGTAEPADLTTPWATVSASWVPIGYTEDGSELSYNPATSPVDVAEELDHIQVVTTGRDSSVQFAMSQITSTAMKLAFNGGVLTTGTGIVTFEPPDLGTEVRTMLGFESEDHTERWVYRQCFQTGTITLGRHKGANNATIATQFSMEKPATGSRLFKAIFQTPLRQLPGRAGGLFLLGVRPALGTAASVRCRTTRTAGRCTSAPARTAPSTSGSPACDPSSWDSRNGINYTLILPGRRCRSGRGRCRSPRRPATRSGTTRTTRPACGAHRAIPGGQGRRGSGTPPR